MINIVVGLMNSGKTLYITYKGLLAFASGKSIISNYDLNFPHYKVNQDFLISMARNEDRILTNTCFLLDELWLWLMDSRGSMNKQSKLASYFFLQSSKDDTEIYITAQDNRQNDVRLRDNCHKISQCSRVLYIDNKFKAISDEKRFLSKADQERLYIKVMEFKKVNIGFYSDVKHSKTEYIKAKPLFQLYETRQKIVSGVI